MVEEVQHQRGVEVGQAQCRGLFAGRPLGESEEEFEGVAVAFDGAGTGALLLDQTTKEEVLHEHGEGDRRRSHDAPVSGRAA